MLQSLLGSLRHSSALPSLYGACGVLSSLVLSCLLLVSSAHAQRASGDSPTSYLDGVVVGVGINTFHGDVDSSPADAEFFRALTTAGLDLRLGVDRRFGPDNRLGVAAHLVYDRIYGEGPPGPRFANNLVSLELVGEYEIPGIRDDLFRLFAGGGPTLLVNPSYSGLDLVGRGNPTIVRERGTRVVGSIVLGVTIADRVRLGTRIATTDYLDGLRTSGRNQPVDLLGFINIGYRFDLSN